MEPHRFIEDEKEYIIFQCNKCNQYSYVKKIQKTKKCLRCDKTYKVKNLKPDSIVKGISNALNNVKEKQKELALKEWDNTYIMASKFGFSKHKNQIKNEVLKDYAKKKKNGYNINMQKEDIPSENTNYYNRFIERLNQMSCEFRLIPYHILQFSAKKENIPKDEINIIIKRALKEQILKRLKNNYFQINL